MQTVMLMDPLVSLLVSLGLTRSMVIGVARGGVVLADRIARGLGAPLDVVTARKVMMLDGKALAVGAVAAGGARIVSGPAIEHLGLDDETVDRLLSEAAAGADADLAIIRGTDPAPDLVGRTVLLVDDGAVSGLSLAAAAASVRDRAVAEVIAVVPYAAESALEPIRAAVHRVIALQRWPDGRAEAEHVRRSVTPPTPEEIRDILARRHRDLGTEEVARPVL